MRGVPKNPVECVQCHQVRAFRSGEPCQICKMKTFPNPMQKCFWTPALDDELRRIYTSANTRVALTTGITTLVRKTGFGRGVVRERAQRLGLAFTSKKFWSEQELRTLRDLSGSRSAHSIARTLKRSYASVHQKMHRLELSTRVLDGYTQDQLGELLGVSTKTIRRCVALGYLSPRDGRFSDRAVIAFLRKHPEEYSLKRVDETWFKGMLFPSAACYNAIYGALKPARAVSDNFNEEIA